MICYTLWLLLELSAGLCNLLSSFFFFFTFLSFLTFLVFLGVSASEYFSRSSHIHLIYLFFSLHYEEFALLCFFQRVH